MKDERFVEDLLCELTDAEMIARGKALAQGIAAREQTKHEAAKAQSQAKEDLKAIDQVISALAKEVRAGKELRSVECIERANYEIDQVEVIRLDTGDVIRHRAFEHDERQLSLEPRKGEMPDPLGDSEEAWERSAKQNAAAV